MYFYPLCGQAESFQNHKTLRHMLYLVPTPIGNLEDITLRSIKTLQEVDMVLAEDTRVSGRLLKHYDIDKPLKSFHTHNEHARVDGILQILQSGTKVALISDAGTPGISDPGYLLVRSALDHNIPVISLPGATAFVTALVASGLPSDRFHFEGFLPHKKGRQTRLKYLSALPNTFILYESPHRIKKCLGQLIDLCGKDRDACLAREITKIHEEFIRGTLGDLHSTLESRSSIKGEIVLIVSGSK